MSNTYWLFNWLDAHRIDSASAAERALTTPSLLEDLHEMALLAKTGLPSKVQSENSILAGRGLDLTAKLNCPASSCRQRQVNELFRKAWQYFDWIVVDDAVSHQLTEHWDNIVVHPERLIPEIETLLYLRNIGAEDIVEFRQKPNVCVEYWREIASEAGLEAYLEIGESFVPRLARESDIKIRSHKKGCHPMFSGTLNSRLYIQGN